MSRIKYEKELTGKLVGKGGPRDLQERQRLTHQEAVLRKLVTDEVSIKTPIIHSDVSQYLPLEEVRKKIEDAVEFTRREDKIRYENELREIIKGKDAQISDLRNSVNILNDLLKERSGELRTLQDKIDRLYLKISDGSIEPLVGSKMDKPSLESNIFIDPISKGKELELESHIKVENVETDSGRDVNSDLAKLRNLFKS